MCFDDTGNLFFAGTAAGALSQTARILDVSVTSETYNSVQVVRDKKIAQELQVSIRKAYKSFLYE